MMRCVCVVCDPFDNVTTFYQYSPSINIRSTRDYIYSYAEWKSVIKEFFEILAQKPFIVIRHGWPS